MADHKVGLQYLKSTLITKATWYKVMVSCGEPEKWQHSGSFQSILFLLALSNAK